MLRWLGTNLHTLFWAFALALAVWVSAVIAADPDEVRPFPNPVPIEIVGQDAGLVIAGTYPKQIEVTLRAPRSVWERLAAEVNPIHAILDLSGLSAGQHTVNVQIQVSVRPVRIVSVSPAPLNLTLEPLVTSTLPVDLALSGEPAAGYQAGDATVDPQQVVISGPESLMKRAVRARLVVDLAGVRENIDQSLPPQVLDENSQPVNGLTVNPATVHVTIPVSQQGGYRDVAVKVVVRGQPASGYRITNIFSTPLVVTIFSSDPQLVNAMPGFVETEPLDLNGAKDDISTRLALDLPPGVSVVGEQSVMVQVGVSAIESSLTLSNKPVEIIGLTPDLTATISPTMVDVILSGPLPLLDTLTAQDVRVVVDVTGLSVGIHQLTPSVVILVANIRVESILPGTIEVILTATGTPTPKP